MYSGYALYMQGNPKLLSDRSIANERMQEIYVASTSLRSGDCIASWSLEREKPLYIPLQLHSNQPALVISTRILISDASGPATRIHGNSYGSAP